MLVQNHLKALCWILVPFTSLSSSVSQDFDILKPSGTQVQTVRNKGRAEHFQVGWKYRTSFRDSTLLPYAFGIGSPKGASAARSAWISARPDAAQQPRRQPW